MNSRKSRSKSGAGGDAKTPKFWERISDGNPEEVKFNSIPIGKHPKSSVTFRISQLSPLRTSGNETKYIRFVGIDGTGKMGMVAFGEKAEMLSELLKVNKIFRIENFEMKKSTFNNQNELIVQRESSVEIKADDEQIPPLDIEFVNFDAVTSNYSLADVLGIVTNIGEVVTGTKADQPWRRLEISLLDKRSTELKVTLWGEYADRKYFVKYTAVAFLDANIVMYNDSVSLSCGSNSTVWTNPDLKEAGELLTWFKSEAAKHNLNLDE